MGVRGPLPKDGVGCFSFVHCIHVAPNIPLSPTPTGDWNGKKYYTTAKIGHATPPCVPLSRSAPLPPSPAHSRPSQPPYPSSSRKYRGITTDYCTLDKPDQNVLWSAGLNLNLAAAAPVSNAFPMPESPASVTAIQGRRGKKRTVGCFRA